MTRPDSRSSPLPQAEPRQHHRRFPCRVPRGAPSRMRAPSLIAVMVMLSVFVDAREARGGVWIAAHEPRDLGEGAEEPRERRRVGGIFPSMERLGIGRCDEIVRRDAFLDPTL